MATPLRLLMLEDNPSDAELVLHALRHAGYDPMADRVETEQDFRDHLETAPEIILADFSMPAFDSLCALEILQQRHLDIPFIIVSGTIGEERAVQAMCRGATDYVMKDRMGRLGQAVAQALEQKRLRDAKRRADQALFESERRLGDMMRNVQLISLMLDRNARITYCNDYLLRLTGWQREEVLGRDWFELFVPPEIDNVKQVFTELLMDLPTAWHHENEILTRAGERRIIHWNNSVLRSASGDVIGTTSIGEDITERKRLEERLRQSQKMDGIGRLAGGVAHDFNNLLTVILGRADLLERRPDLPETARRGVHLIHETASRAAVLTRQLLQFSRQQVLQPLVLDLNVLIPEMQELLRRLISEDIDLLLKLNSKAGKIKADPGQIQQVIMNLVINARDAMPNGGKMTIETSNVELEADYCRDHGDASPGPHVMLAVGDSGCGMDESVRARIFEPFFTTKEQGKGTGLGLSTVYGIVKQAGGNIYVYSEVKHGTIFKVYFPEVKDKTHAEIQYSEPLPVKGGGETILLVEDEEGIRDLLYDILTDKGYTVLSASDGEHALQCSERHKAKIDLLLTDVVMPKLNGKELAQKLAQTRSEMKVIYMSGYTSEAIVHRGVLDEGIEFLEKPFTPITVARRMREVLDSPAKGAPEAMLIH